MIDDEELRLLFKTESEEHLQKLEEGLLRLEEDPGDRPMLEEVFRGAHSLKGAANMMDIRPVERIAHRFEDVLGAGKRGESQLKPAVFDALHRQLDAIRAFVHEAVEGVAADLDVDEIMRQLDAALDAAADGTPEDAGGVPDEAPPPEATPEALPEALPATTPQPSAAKTPDYRIDTVRVDAHRLDDLLVQAGELNVATVRFSHLVKELERIAALCQRARRQGTALDPKELGDELDLVHQSAGEGHHRLEQIADQLEEEIRNVRLMPVSTIFKLFSRMVRDLCRDQGKEVRLELEGEETRIDKGILEELKDPLMHALRNAVDHGVEPPDQRRDQGKETAGRIFLRALQTGNQIRIEVEDDGRGLDLERVKETAVRRQVASRDEVAAMSPEQVHRLVFEPGFSTRDIVTDVSGRGVGMDVVRTVVEGLKGSIHLQSEAGKGSLLRLTLPLTLATTHSLIVRQSGRHFAIPIDYIHTTCPVGPEDLFSLDGRQQVMLQSEPLEVTHLQSLLGQETGAENRSAFDCAVLKVATERLGLLVDGLEDQREITVKPFRPPLKHVPNVIGTTILGNGEICMVLHPPDLLRSQRRPVRVQAAAPQRQRVILLAEDSIVTRTQEKRILEGAGYQVVAAVDGQDAYSKLGQEAFDAVVSDVEMPNMTGLELAEKIRQDPAHAELPIILVTSLSSEDDRRRGAEAGANAYLTKSTFDQQSLLEALERLI